jgi:hypothetical protein
MSSPVTRVAKREIGIPTLRETNSVNSSPTSVLQEAHSSLRHGSPPFPIVERRGLKRRRSCPSTNPQTKKVRFDGHPENGRMQKRFIESNVAQDHIPTLWTPRSELRQTYRQATEAVREIRQRKDPYVQQIVCLFQACSKPSTNLPQLVYDHMTTLENPPREDLRGLERNLHSMLNEYRAFHVKRLLKMQKELPSKQPETHTRLLRIVSKNTSRVSRAWALVLANGDLIQVSKIVREELGRQQE